VRELALILALALIIDAIVGDPDWLWRRVPHPVVLFGKLIELADKYGNGEGFSARRRRLHGALALIALLGLAGLMGWGLAWLCRQLGGAGVVIEAVIASFFLAQNSLSRHVWQVYQSYEAQGLVGARREVAKIVGRDPEKLDEAGICRAAIESLSENSSDGIIAPAFWYLLGGLSGMMIYKMLNTADSMIGHKNSRYANFGWSSARLDDVANWLPARLSVVLVAFATLILYGIEHFQQKWTPVLRRKMRKNKKLERLTEPSEVKTALARAKAAIIVSLSDASKHRSPNAGWPESAYAGALDISLAGPRSYGAEIVDAAFQNQQGKAPRPADIVRALILFWGSMAVFFIVIFLIFLIGLFL